MNEQRKILILICVFIPAEELWDWFAFLFLMNGGLVAAGRQWLRQEEKTNKKGKLIEQFMKKESEWSSSQSTINQLMKLIVDFDGVAAAEWTGPQGADAPR